MNITFGLNTDKQGGHGKEGPQHPHPGVGVVGVVLWLLDTTQHSWSAGSFSLQVSTRVIRKLIWIIRDCNSKSWD